MRIIPKFGNLYNECILFLKNLYSLHSALCVSSGLLFTLSRIETYVIGNVLSVKSTITLHSTAHTNHTSYKNLLHAPMFTLTVKMSLQMFYSEIMAHMPSAYGLGKNTIFNKVQFSSVLIIYIFVKFKCKAFL